MTSPSSFAALRALIACRTEAATVPASLRQGMITDTSISAAILWGFLYPPYPGSFHLFPRRSPRTNPNPRGSQSHRFIDRRPAPARRLYPMSEPKRILVAMSGGVDSSVAALLLKREGFDVTGAYMKNWINEDGVVGDCPWMEDIDDARRVADQIGVPFKVVNLMQDYRARVVQYMLEGYGRGSPRIPTSCATAKSSSGCFGRGPAITVSPPWPRATTRGVRSPRTARPAYWRAPTRIRTSPISSR